MRKPITVYLSSHRPCTAVVQEVELHETKMRLRCKIIGIFHFCFFFNKVDECNIKAKICRLNLM